ncbi:hypothetical protein D3C71_1577740 [compost metagenome]
MEGLKVFFCHIAFVEQRIALYQAFLKRRLCLLAQSAFGALPRCQPLQYPAHFNGSGDIVGAHRTHLIAPSAMAHQ